MSVQPSLLQLSSLGTVEIDEVRTRDVPLIVGYGGGVNSWAALLWLREHDIVPDLISFADTAGEKPGTYRHLNEVVIPWCGNYFPRVTIVKKDSPRVGDESLEAECLRRETMPSRAFGKSSCAMRWKVEPQDKFLNSWLPARAAWATGKKPIKILGYDAGEDSRATIFEDAKLRYWYPLYDFGIDREGCEELIRSAGQPAPPKSACFFCPSSTKSEVLSLAAEHPDLMARALAIEDTALRSERHNLRNIRGLGRHWSWRELLEADEAKRATMRETPVERCMVCADGSQA